MQTESKNRTEVKYNRKTTVFFNNLFVVLLEANYFSYLESALEYVTQMRSFIDNCIFILPRKPAPDYFSKYGKNLYYIAYQPNKRTTWYIFFKQKENCFFVCYITNNHYEGQYIR